MPNPVTYTPHYHLPTNNPVELGEDTLHMIVFCLRIAAKAFDQDAQLCVNEPHALTMLTNQFTLQAVQARELASRIENASFVRLGKEVE